MIAEEILRITQMLPEGVRLVAVSKYHPAEAIRIAYTAQQHVFGESHAQELQQKHKDLEDLKELEWHFIGHLQTNKVKYIASYVDLIHAVDSPRLLAEINKQAEKAKRVIPCLLQLHIAQEETKFGFTPDEARFYLEQGEWRQFEHIRLAGIMAMASHTDDTHHIRKDFHQARLFFEEAQKTFFSNQNMAGGSTFKELSMGMSDDWHIAIDEGSTLIRIGTRIFGQRQY